MPQSITIAAFVFGAVLLLIALLGGGFKIFGAEVSGKAGAFGRPVAGVAGVILVLLGLFGAGSHQTQPSTQQSTSDHPQTQPSAEQSTSDRPRTTPAVSQPKATQDATETPAEAVKPRDQAMNISGIWHDASGGAYQLLQRGNTFTFTASGQGVMSEGRGTIRGLEYEAFYNSAYVNGVRTTGRCTGTISADGNMIQGSCVDSVLGQSFNTLTR